MISPPSNTRTRYGPMSVGSQSPLHCPRTSQDIATFKYMNRVWSRVRGVPKSLPKSSSPRYCPMISPPSIQGHGIVPCPWSPKVLCIVPGHTRISPPSNTRTWYGPTSAGFQSPQYCPRTSQDIPTFKYKNRVWSHVRGVPKSSSPRYCPRISPPQIQIRTWYDPMSVGSQSPRYCPRTSQNIPTFKYKNMV